MTDRVRIATARLVLRPLRPTDEADVVAGIGRWEVARWLSRAPHPYAPDHFRDYLPAATPGRVWAIEDAAGFAGMIGIDPELGYWLTPRTWRRGYATEAAVAVLGRHFSVPGAGTVRTGHFAGNDVSRSVLLKLGFRPDGFRLIQPVNQPDTPVLLARLSLTREDWLKRP